MAEQRASCDEGNAQRRERKPCRGPASLGEEQPDEGDDGAETDPTESDAKSRQPYGPRDLEQASRAMRGRRWWAHGCDQRQYDERNQRCRKRDRSKTVAAVEGRASRSADRKSGVERRADPGHDLAGVLRAHERQPPAECARDDEAFRDAEHRAAEKKNAERNRRRYGEAKRQQIEQPRRRSDQKAGDDGVLGALFVRVMPSPHSRKERSRKLAARDKSDDERAEPQVEMHVKREHRHSQADDKIRNEDHGHDRYQRRDRSVWAGRAANRTTCIVILMHDRSRSVFTERNSLSLIKQLCVTRRSSDRRSTRLCYMRQFAMRLDG